MNLFMICDALFCCILFIPFLGSLKRVTFSTHKAMTIIVIIIGFAIILLILLTFVGQPYQSYVTFTTNNQTTYLIQCDYQYSIVQIIMFIFEGISMIVGIRLCWLVRDVPDVVNESKNIATGL